MDGEVGGGVGREGGEALGKKAHSRHASLRLQRSEWESGSAAAPRNQLGSLRQPWWWWWWWERWEVVVVVVGKPPVSLQPLISSADS